VGISRGENKVEVGEFFLTLSCNMLEGKLLVTFDSHSRVRVKSEGGKALLKHSTDFFKRHFCLYIFVIF